VKYSDTSSYCHPQVRYHGSEDGRYGVLLESVQREVNAVASVGDDDLVLTGGFIDVDSNIVNQREAVVDPVTDFKFKGKLNRPPMYPPTIQPPPRRSKL